MQHLKYTLFDLFVYTLPGILLVTGSYALIQHYNGVAISPAIESLLSGANIYKALLFIALSYCLGFLASVVGNYILWVKELCFPPFKKGLRPTGLSKKFVAIRENAKENFKYVEQWNVLKNFAATLSFTVLLLGVLFFIFFDWFSIYHLMAGIVAFFLLLQQATVYHRWALIDLDNAYNLYVDGRNK